MGAMVERDLLRGVGRRVQAFRSMQDITQGELAKRIGLSRTSVTNLEAGRQNVPIAALVSIADELHTTVGALLGEVPLPEVPDVEVACTVRCAQCGEVEVTDSPEKAETIRRGHVRDHWTGEVVPRA